MTIEIVMKCDGENGDCCSQAQLLVTNNIDEIHSLGWEWWQGKTICQECIAKKTLEVIEKRKST